MAFDEQHGTRRASERCWAGVWTRSVTGVPNMWSGCAVGVRLSASIYSAVFGGGNRTSETIVNEKAISDCAGTMISVLTRGNHKTVFLWPLLGSARANLGTEVGLWCVPRHRQCCYW